MEYILPGMNAAASTVQYQSLYTADTPSQSTLLQHPSTLRAWRANSDRIPRQQPFDKEIRALQGTTSALGLRQDVLQSTKSLKWPSSEQYMVDLVRINSALKRELQFLRLEYEAAQVLVQGLYSVAHQMYLNYFAHDAGQLHTEWFDQAHGIDQCLQRYDEAMRKAEADFIELSRHQAKRDRSDWI